jgi:hypothetical protein
VASFLLFLFRMCLSLALAILASHFLRGHERMLMLAFTAFYLLPFLPDTSGVLFLFILLDMLWEDLIQWHLRPVDHILFWCPIIAFWSATRWNARRNGQRRSA